MKNKFQIILVAAGLLLAVTSCDKKLDQYPNNAIVTETFWKNANDAKLALAGCYANIPNIAYDFWYFDGASDNTYDQYPWESNATYISAGTINPGLVNGISGDYNNEYNNIRSCNNFLDNIGKISMDDATKNQYIGEVRFLRAFDYYLLAQLFGDVPLITSSSTAQDTLTPVAENKVIDFVKSELDSSAALLPADPANSGHAGRGAALALKARVELMYSDWQDAADDAQKVMQMNKYSLFKVTSLSAADYADDYSNLVTFANDADKEKFYLGLRSYQNMYFSANEGNAEFIFECQFSDAAPYQWGGLSNGLNVLMMPGDLNGWSSISPTQSLVDAYWNRDGSAHTPISQATLAQEYNYPNTPQPAYFDQFKNRDPRFYASIFYTGSTWKAFDENYTFKWGGQGNSNSATGFNFRKLVDPKYATSPQWQAAQSYPLIRYAEVLLTYAEAKNEVSGPDATVFAAIDSVRSRAGMPFVNQNISQSALRELIHNERRTELAGEGLRYFDIRRWNIASQVMKDVYDVTNSKTQARSWQDIYKKLPYPQAAVDNNPKLKAAQTAKGY